MNEPTITMTVKEAEALDAEIASLHDQIAKAAAEKTAAAKSDITVKIAEAITAVMVDRKMISAEKVAETKECLKTEEGIASYFKKACELYQAAEAGRKEAIERLKEVPQRLGKVDTEKKAGEGTIDPPANKLQEANAKFAQRVLAHR